MSEVQDPANASADPRWIVLRVSRINLGIMLAGALLAFPVMLLISEIPVWVRLTLLAALVLSMLWDLQLVLLKGRHSVGAFYLLDLDPPRDTKASRLAASRLGIRIRFARPSAHANTGETEGIVLKGSFVTPWFTALRYRLPGDAAWRRVWPRVIPLWPDSLDENEFRRIRVALKWK